MCRSHGFQHGGNYHFVQDINRLVRIPPVLYFAADMHSTTYDKKTNPVIFHDTMSWMTTGRIISRTDSCCPGDLQQVAQRSILASPFQPLEPFLVVSRMTP
jgi:hypothetical protein